MALSKDFEKWKGGMPLDYSKACGNRRQYSHPLYINRLQRLLPRELRRPLLAQACIYRL